jgi:Tol biopolymer transport system component
VWRSIVSCVVIGGCSFESQAVPGDSAVALPGPRPGDAAIEPSTDAAGDAPVSTAPDCFARWFDGNLQISPPVVLASVSSDDNDRDPWISPDQRTLYFSRSSSMSGTGDIFLATRDSIASDFDHIRKVDNLSTAFDEDRASLTADLKMLVLSSNRDSKGGSSDIYIANRPDLTIDFPSPDSRQLMKVNMDAATTHLDPFLNPDGTRLYLAPVFVLGGQQIVVASRADSGADFGTPALLGGIHTSGNDADPALSPDELILVFTSTRPGGIGRDDLWYATRPDVRHDFGTPRPLATANSSFSDSDPMLSADGCTLYFASTRNTSGATYDLFVATIAP